VGTAEHLGILLGGGPALTEGHDVVHLALLGREVAEGVLALSVAYFDDPAGGPGEKACGL
jgi:hypothetical protein